MAPQRVERTVPNREGDDLFRDVEQTLDPYVKKYSLSREVDSANRHIMVKKTGFKGDLQVEGNKVSLSLDYSRLMPGPMRRKITDAVVSALDKMAQAKEGA